MMSKNHVKQNRKPKHCFLCGVQVSKRNEKVSRYTFACGVCQTELRIEGLENPEQKTAIGQNYILEGVGLNL